MPAQDTTQVSYKFGEFELDLARQALLRDGNVLELRPQSFDVLRLLVTRCGQLVTKEELHSDIWGNVAVTDSSITHCISDIRKVLDDSDRSIVRTVPRRGFVFAADVSEIIRSEDPGPRAGTTPRMRLIVFGAAAVIAVVAWWLAPNRHDDLPSFADFPANSLAVLPFEGAERNRTAGSPYLGAAFSDELREQMERVRGLRVAARTSSVVVRELESDTTRAAARLGVRYVLTGSFLQKAHDLRLSAQLLEAESGRTLWAQTYNVDPEGLLDVQQAIADQVVGQILPDTQAATATSATLNPTANELMLLARDKERRVRERQEVDVPLLLEAVQLYRAAVETDPTSALAHSRLAGALMYLGDVRGAEVPLLRALKLDPEISEVQDTLGKFHFVSRSGGANEAWAKAIRLNPNNADALASYAWSRWMEGDDNGTVEFYRRALELDPLSLSRYADLGNFLGMMGRVEETREVVASVENIFDDTASVQLVADLLELLGEVDKSIALTVRARDMNPDDPTLTWKLAELYAVIGDFETAQRLQPEADIALLFRMRRYDELVDTAEELMIEHPNDVMVRYLLAFAYNATAQFSSAVYVLEASALPDIAMRDTRRPEDFEAFLTLINAANGAGDRGRAFELARWWVDFDHVEQTDWWVATYTACAHAVLGERELALDALERVLESPRLAPAPVLLDSPCFERFATEPRYQAVLEHFEARRAELRQRLPQTLKEYGVAL